MSFQPKKRQLPRFGLKWLFIAVTIVAVYFGSWPWLEKRALRDVDAVAESRFKTEWERRRDAAAEEQYQAKLRRVREKNRQPGYVWTFEDFVVYDQSGLRPTYLFLEPSTVVPYIVNATEAEFEEDRVSGWRRRRFLWLFGWTVPLPLAVRPPDEVPAILNYSVVSDDNGSSLIHHTAASRRRAVLWP